MKTVIFRGAIPLAIPVIPNNPGQKCGVHTSGVERFSKDSPSPKRKKPRWNRSQLKQIEARMKGALSAKISEGQFQNQVREIATWTGWLVYHTHNSIHSPAGFPDLVMARAPRLIFAELKSDAGAIREEQTHWLDELGGVAGIETYVWRPADIEEITRILSKR